MPPSAPHPPCQPANRPVAGAGLEELELTGAVAGHFMAAHRVTDEVEQAGELAGKAISALSDAAERAAARVDRAGDHGGRLRGTGHLEVVGSVVKLGMRGGDLHIDVHDAEHVPARCDDLRLDEAGMRRTGGRERGQHVVGTIAGRVAVAHRPHRDDVGHIARRADGHGIGAGIAGRCHYNYPRSPRFHDRLVQRVVPIMRLRRRAERHI